MPLLKSAAPDKGPVCPALESPHLPGRKGVVRTLSLIHHSESFTTSEVPVVYSDQETNPELTKVTHDLKNS
ncbi:hypothetical protein TNCV_596431 [Trichonephila clavipes]|nr:hypothetical protein TNCV_596431 [Trichonephila clavipes]